MPELQELTLQSPDMMHDHFYLKKESKDYQKWEEIIIAGEELEFFDEQGQQWIKATITSTYIDDGSGNAPGANAHYYLQWTDEQGEGWRYTMRGGIRVRVNAPTDDELKQRSWCEGGDWEGGWNGPADWRPCHEHGKRYIAPSGQACWYCEKHAVTNAQWTFALDELHRDFSVPLEAMRVKRIDTERDGLLWHVLIEMDKQYHEYIPVKCSVLVSMKNGQFIRDNVGEWTK